MNADRKQKIAPLTSAAAAPGMVFDVTPAGARTTRMTRSGRTIIRSFGLQQKASPHLKFQMKSGRIDGFAYLAAFIACVPIANWMVGNIGTICVPNGPCLIPVAPALMAPSGVLMIGLAFVLRDLIQRRLGRIWSLGAIILGVALSVAVAPPSLILASAVAFFVSELADFLVYTPLQRRRFVTAVVAGSTIGLIVDSVIFLWLAFGSLEFFWGQVIGKAWMVLASLPFIYWLRVRDSRLSVTQDAKSVAI